MKCVYRIKWFRLDERIIRTFKVCAVKVESAR